MVRPLFKFDLSEDEILEHLYLYNQSRMLKSFNPFFL